MDVLGLCVEKGRLRVKELPDALGGWNLGLVLFLDSTFESDEIFSGGIAEAVIAGERLRQDWSVEPVVRLERDNLLLLGRELYSLGELGVRESLLVDEDLLLGVDEDDSLSDLLWLD